MRPAYRLCLVCGGLVLIVLSFIRLQRHVYSFTNASYHQTSFSAAGLGTGLLLISLSLLPSSGWLERHATARRGKPRHAKRHQRG